MSGADFGSAVEPRVGFDEFAEIMGEEVAALPEYALEGLEGGALADPEAKLSPDGLADDLYVLGEYHVGPEGPHVVLYHGSFAKRWPFADAEFMRARIRETVRHEFRHHLETRAGQFGKGTLIEEDALALAKYRKSHGK